jgi:O-6-methylguanine DNA methyltransferase
MLLVTDDQKRVRALDWDDHEDRMRQLLQRHYGELTLRPHARARISSASVTLAAYFDGDVRAVNAVVTATRGTEFQRHVWAALRRIPAGNTTNYAALAATIGKPTAARAVGRANGANSIPVVVPCHRVIGADGSLTGFGGGINRKKWLLTHEGVHLRTELCK